MAVGHEILVNSFGRDCREIIYATHAPRPSLLFFMPYSRKKLRRGEHDRRMSGMDAAKVSAAQGARRWRSVLRP
ncbi:hypothetical protein C9I36_20780 [Pectobacterium punjabense]|nr:hypothetical protein C9I36_20780 [Pectobacterium punjabense]